MAHDVWSPALINSRRATAAPMAEDAALVEQVRERLERAGWTIGRIYSGPAYVFTENSTMLPLPEADGWMRVEWESAGTLAAHFAGWIEEVEWLM